MSDWDYNRGYRDGQNDGISDLKSKSYDAANENPNYSSRSSGWEIDYRTGWSEGYKSISRIGKFSASVARFRARLKHSGKNRTT